jgi:hypothetical protein
MKTRIFRRLIAVPVLVLAVQALAPAAGANHAWGGYHWARTTNPFTLTLLDSVTSPWEPYLATTAADWHQSTVLDIAVGTGDTRNAKRCPGTTGKVEVCNSTYGRNGWLGIAQISISGSHILAGTVKLNDSYFNSAAYNTPAWRNLVMCQEVGHTLGLDHQDEVHTNANLGTCMDYTNNPSTNQHPNAHDYAMLESIYSHTDSTTTVAASPAKPGSLAAEVHGQAEWGQAVRYAPNGRPVLFVRTLSGNVKHFTWVTWAE